MKIYKYQYEYLNKTVFSSQYQLDILIFKGGTVVYLCVANP